MELPVELSISARDVAAAPPLVSPDANALRRKVEALEEQNKALKGEVSTLKKRVASSAAKGASAPKKAKTGLKKLFDNWSSALGEESSNHRHYHQFQHNRYKVTVKDDCKCWTPAEISDLFGGHGEKIQPTPWNKPKSTVTIIRFDSYAKVKDFFAHVGSDIDEEYEVQLWRKPDCGAIYQYDTVDSKMWQMEVHYSKRQKALSLTFSFVLGPLLDLRFG